MACPAFAVAALKETVRKDGREGIVMVTMERMSIKVTSLPPSRIHEGAAVATRPISTIGLKDKPV